MNSLLVALLLAQTTIYAWTDKSGVQHFTDDLSTIPKGVKVRTTEGEVVSRIDADVKANPPKVVAQAKDEKPAAPNLSEQQWRQIFRDATRKVENLEQDIERDRKQVEEVNGMPIRAGFTCATGWWSQPVYGTTVNAGVGQTGQGSTVTVGSGPSVMPTVAPCYYSHNPEFERVRERLASNRRELVRAREDLADLDRRASFAAVPREWRR